MYKRHSRNRGIEPPQGYQMTGLGCREPAVIPLAHDVPLCVGFGASKRQPAPTTSAY